LFSDGIDAVIRNLYGAANSQNKAEQYAITPAA
jgi:hypothetical protein